MLFVGIVALHLQGVINKHRGYSTGARSSLANSIR